MSDTQRRRSSGLDALIAGSLAGIERLPALQSVVDRLAQLMTGSLRTITGENGEVTIDAPRSVRFRDFLGEIAAPAMIAVLRIEPWDGYCLAALDANLVGATIHSCSVAGATAPAPAMLRRGHAPHSSALWSSGWQPM